MKAFIKTTYGGPEILRLEEVEKPSVKDNHILVKVLASSVNPADWHILRGKPIIARFTTGLFRPKEKILGADFAGIVEQTGANVSHFNVGDPVFGESLMGGAFAEYVCVLENACAKMPEGVGFPEMASVPIAGLTAYQAIVTYGKVKAGESVLINGSAGGVGHFAVQIAKANGAKVIAVCSGRNTEFVKSLGANHVIAYDQENIHHHAEKYDLVLDTHGNLTFGDFKRMGERGVLTGFTTMGNMLSVQSKSIFNKFSLKQFTAKANTQDLEALAALIQEGKIKPHIEKTYPYEEIPSAITYIEAMHTRGKVAATWENSIPQQVSSKNYK